jgi:FkbM family methyltransferase
MGCRHGRRDSARPRSTQLECCLPRCTGHRRQPHLGVWPAIVFTEPEPLHAIKSIIGDATQWAVRHRGTDALRKALAERGCYIYGAGGFGREVAAALAAGGYRLHGFVDASASGDVAGVSCCKPEEIDATAADAVLILAVNNFKTPVEAIAAWARSVPFADVLHVAELPDVLDPALGHYWQASRGLMADCAGELADFDSMLGDERSRQILAALVRYRITGRAEDHPAVDRDHQYFPQDLPMGKSRIDVVDCGAFPGDMLGSVAAAGLELGNWYAFEPDPGNFRHLRDVTAETGGFGSASLFPCGVGDTSGMVRFSGGAADASRAVADGDDGTVVPIVRVGDVVHAERIDLVKLDVEGFEMQAIDGMVELLARHRPRLAVAVYHQPRDLWEIAFKIDRMLPGGRYAIRQHGYNGYDTVLYVDL